jgi:hypothetical protein
MWAMTSSFVVPTTNVRKLIPLELAPSGSKKWKRPCLWRGVAAKARQGRPCGSSSRPMTDLTKLAGGQFLFA